MIMYDKMIKMIPNKFKEEAFAFFDWNAIKIHYQINRKNLKLKRTKITE